MVTGAPRLAGTRGREDWFGMDLSDCRHRLYPSLPSLGKGTDVLRTLFADT